MVNPIRPIVHLEHIDPKRSNAFQEIEQLFRRGSTQVDILSGPITAGIEGADNELNFNTITRAANTLGHSSTSTQTVYFGYEPARYWVTLSA